MRKPRLYSACIAIAALGVFGSRASLNDTPTQLGNASPPSVAGAQKANAFKGHLSERPSGTLPAPAARAKVQSARGSLARLPLTNGTKVISPDSWAWQNPLPQGNDLNGVWGTGSTDVFAVGVSGAIDHFDGTGWSGMSSNTTSDLYAVWGSDPMNVYAVGAGGTLLYFNGTWAQIASGTTVNLYGIWGSSPSNVYAVGGAGTVLHFDGSTWSTTTPGVNDLRAVWGSSWQDVYAVGAEGTILHHDNTGWSIQASGTTNLLYAVGGSSSSDVYAVGADGIYLHSDGTAWNAFPHWADRDIRAIWVDPSTTAAFFSTDIGEVTYGVWGSSELDVFFVGPNGSIWHWDGSEERSMTVGPTNTDFLGVSGSSSTDVWTVGDSYDTAWASYDGSTWHFSGWEVGNRNIWVSPATDKFAVSYCWVFHFSSLDFGSATWTTLPSCPLYGIGGSAATDVYAVGAGGGMFHYDGNADHQWTDLNPAHTITARDLYSVHASSPSAVFVVGAGGTIVQFDYGTKTSSTTTVGVHDLHGVWGSSASDVFVVGAAGTIMHSNGDAWATMDSGTSNDLYGVWGSSGTDVFAVGAAGIILHYEGHSWSAMKSGASNDLYGVWGNSSTDVFAVGAGGTILHYEPPTATPNPVPTTTGISPTAKTVGNADFTLTVNGTHFLSSSVTRFNGSNRPTTYVNDTQLTATILASDLTSAGTFQITVFNPAPGGGTSGAQILTVSQASTSLSVTPASAVYGGTVNLSATLTSGSSGVSWREIAFTLNGTTVGKATTGPSGLATLTGAPLGTLSVGAHTGYIGATFVGDPDYAGSSASGDLTVSHASTSLSVTPASGSYGGTVNLSATLAAGATKVGGRQITFSLRGTVLGSVPTDTSGLASLASVSIGGIGAAQYPAAVVATFAGDDSYSGTMGTADLTVYPAQTYTVAQFQIVNDSARPQTVPLTAAVTSPAVPNELPQGNLVFTVFSTTNAILGTYVVPILNGSAAATFVLQPNIPGPLLIQARFLGSQNFAGSMSHSSYIYIYKANAHLKVSAFRVDPAYQSPDPRTLTLAATVENQGPDLAENVTASFYWGPAGSPRVHLLQAVPLGDMPTGPSSVRTLTIQYPYTLPDGSDLDVTLSSPYVVAESSSVLRLNAFRYFGFREDVDGYSFINEGSGHPDPWTFPGPKTTEANWSVFSDTFGADAVSWDVPLIGRVNKPLAQVFYSTVYQPWFAGNCYGMAASSLRFVTGQDSLTSLVPGATTVNALQTDHAQGNAVWHNIERFQGYELGLKIIEYYIGHVFDSMATGVSRIINGMQPGATTAPMILTLENPGNLAGHALVPYRLVETEAVDGSSHTATVFVYDSNFPNDSTRAVLVDLKDHSWSFPFSKDDQGQWVSWGGWWGFLPVPMTVNDSTPELVYSGVPILNIFAGSGSATMLNTDSQGRSLGYQNRVLVEQVPGGRRMRPWIGSTQPIVPEAYVLPAGDYVTTLSGTDTGAAAASLFISGALLSFTSASMTPSTVDTIRFSQDGNTIVLGTNAASEQYATTLFKDLGASTRKFTVGNTTMANGEVITQTLVSGGTAFQIANQGGAKSYDLALEQVGAGAGKTVVTGLTLGANETGLIRVRDWNHLNTTEVDLEVRNSAGTIVRTQTLQAVHGSFYTVTPCRVLDTRNQTGPLGAPPLQPGATRTFNVAASCGIPAGAVAISANVTVTNVGASGELVVFSSDIARPSTSAISFGAGRTRANNAIISLSGSSTAFSVFNNSSAAVDFILDVNGYVQ